MHLCVLALQHAQLSRALPAQCMLLEACLMCIVAANFDSCACAEPWHMQLWRLLLRQHLLHCYSCGRSL